MKIILVCQYCGVKMERDRPLEKVTCFNCKEKRMNMYFHKPKKHEKKPLKA